MTSAALAQTRPAPTLTPTPFVIGVAVAAVAGLYVLVGTVGLRMPLELPQPVQKVVNTMRIVPPLDGLHADRLAATFSRMNYRLDTVRMGERPVPRLLLSRLPADLKSLTVGERKRLFLRVMLPLVLSANDAVLEHRRRLKGLLALMQAGKPLPPEESDYLARLAQHYEVESADPDALLERVDAVPVSLALAQAATESGWGTSRFAREGNALFGQWTFSGKGMAPREAGPDAKHGVRAFGDLQAAVRAYIHNLNTHPAYREFRRERARMRAEGKRPDGRLLASTLHRYSERGEEYIDTLLTIIRVNELAPFDMARLGAVPQIARNRDQ